jgi:hypothetical protein
MVFRSENDLDLWWVIRESTDVAGGIPNSLVLHTCWGNNSNHDAHGDHHNDHDDHPYVATWLWFCIKKIVPSYPDAPCMAYLPTKRVDYWGKCSNSYPSTMEHMGYSDLT